MGPVPECFLSIAELPAGYELLESWLGNKDSNLDNENQNLVSYH
jgi:hypothetical protein